MIKEMKKKIDEIKIIHEDKNLLAINKPSFLVVHKDGRTDEESVLDWVMLNYPKLKNVGEKIKISNESEEIDRYGILHRIDRDTSGILLIAKNQIAYDYFKNLFLEHKIEKTYHLFVYGNIKEDEGKIDLPISRNKNDGRLWSATKSRRGNDRDAVTYFKILQRSKEATFVEANPKTGRTHQIRVHFKAINHAVISDPLYAPNQPKLLGFERTALHSRMVKFDDFEGNSVEIVAEYPKDFKNAIEILKKQSLTN